MSFPVDASRACDRSCDTAASAVALAPSAIRYRIIINLTLQRCNIGASKGQRRLTHPWIHNSKSGFQRDIGVTALISNEKSCSAGPTPASAIPDYPGFLTLVSQSLLIRRLRRIYVPEPHICITRVTLPSFVSFRGHSQRYLQEWGHPSQFKNMLTPTNQNLFVYSHPRWSSWKFDGFNILLFICLSKFALNFPFIKCV